MRPRTTSRRLLQRSKDRKTSAFEKQNDMVQYQILLHDYESSRALYEGLVATSFARRALLPDLSRAKWTLSIWRAYLGTPSEMGRTATVLLGLIAGLAMGLLGAVLIASIGPEGTRRIRN